MNTPETDQNERPTPETDANASFSIHSHILVPVEFARKLERERDEAREKATNFYAKIGELDQALKASAELLCFFFEKAGITRKDLEERLEAAK